MPTREQLKRIAVVRRLREAQEKIRAREVGIAQTAALQAQARLARLEADIAKFAADISAALREGVEAADLPGFHAAWVAMRNRREAAREVLNEALRRLEETLRAYYASRVERKRMETWEERTDRAIRADEAHRETVAVDELTVLRHGRHGGGPA